MKLEDYTKMKEDRDYELVPIKLEDDGAEAWIVRILTGEFIESIIAFGAIKIDGTHDDPLMTFDFSVFDSPDPELSSENKDLQAVAGDILLSLMVRGIEEGSLLINDETE